MCSVDLSSIGVPDTPEVQADGEGGEDEGSKNKSRSESSASATRDISSCGLCDHKPFANRSFLYRHYSTGHFWKSLKQFINVKEKTCTICEYGHPEMIKLVIHVGATHAKVEQFLDPSFHVPKRQLFSNKKSSNNKCKKSSNNECNLCQKQFSDRKCLAAHHSLRHFKEELNQFIDEEQILCKICHSKFSNIYNLRIHVGDIHKKVEDFMPGATKQDDDMQSFDHLDLDLELSSDEDQEEPEISQGDGTEEDDGAGESQFNREDSSVDDIDEEGEVEEEFGKEVEREKKDEHSRKRLRVSGKDDRNVTKRKKVTKTVAKVQENVKSPNSTAVDCDGDEVSISTQKVKDSQDVALRDGSHQDQGSNVNKDINNSHVAKSSEERDDIDYLLSDSD